MNLHPNFEETPEWIPDLFRKMPSILQYLDDGKKKKKTGKGSSKRGKSKKSKSSSSKNVMNDSSGTQIKQQKVSQV